MPRNRSFPTLFDGVLQLNISKLKELRYLMQGRRASGTVTWSRNGHETGSISITANMDKDDTYIQLDYKYRDEPRNYRIDIISIPSNLKKGYVLYFRCPQTGKQCRILYSIGGYFLHREAFKGCMYECQTKSKHTRHLDKIMDGFIQSDKLYEQLYKKHFKKTYNGKPTKKYLRLKEKIEKAESIPYHEIERMFLPR